MYHPQAVLVNLCMCPGDNCCFLFLALEEEKERASEKNEQMKKQYTEIFIRAAFEMSNIPVKKLQYSLFSLPPGLQKDQKKFYSEAKAAIVAATSSDDVMFVVGEHHHYLHFSLLKFIIDHHGSEDLKKRMNDYVKTMEVFRKETRLKIFSEVCNDEPEEFNERFAKMVTKHEIDWNTATLEDMEKLRIQLIRELSLYEFTLNIIKVVRGCVEVTWRIPRSLVTYIQSSIKPSSQSMADHHITTLTIDGFIIYDSSFGMYTLIAFTANMLITSSFNFYSNAG